MIGRTILHYQILKLLCEGGIGQPDAGAAPARAIAPKTPVVFFDPAPVLANAFWTSGHSETGSKWHSGK